MTSPRLMLIVRNPRVHLLAFGLMALAAVGCGETRTERVPLHPVQGAITFRGQPISGAFVTFHPKAPVDDFPAPRASVNETGSFNLSTFSGGDGAPEGEYVVTIQWYKPIRKGGDVVPGPNVIPRKYGAANTSNVNIRIASGENQLPPIRL